jgi:hypothetical protein
MSLALARHQAGRRTAAAHAPALHSVVQGARRQRAACAALPLPLGQRCAPSARLTADRSRERKRKAETEGQIKGAARRAPTNHSARGFAAAPQRALRVPRRGWNPHRCGVCRVPLSIRRATVRWSRHGWQ